MINVLIVEDDIIARNRLRSMVDWEALDFHIIAEASNGLDALKLAERLKPGLVLADVSMPVMDGMQLSRELSRLDEDIHLIMISSYSNYDYIRETFKNGAQDYLLKDELTPGSLTGMLEDVKKKLSARGQTKQGISPYQQLSDLLLGVQQPEFPVGGLLRTLGLAGDECYYVLLVFRLYYYEHMIREMDCGEQMIHSRSILGFVDELFSGVPHVSLWMGSGQVALLLPVKKASRARLQLEMEESVGKIEQRLLKYLDARAQYRWMEFSKQELKGAYRTVVGQMNQCAGKPKTIAYPHLDRIMDALQQVDGAACDQFMRELFTELKQQQADLWSVQPVILSLLNLLDRVTDWQKLSFDKENYVQESIYRCNSIEELYECVQRCCKTILQALKAAQGKRVSPHIESALQYLREHYREQITLPGLAAHVGVAPSYLSGQFSMEVGMTFVEYLNKIRIEAADRLLQSTTCTIKEVYYQVGFNSYNYFFKVYKDIKGESPVQRCKKL